MELAKSLFNITGERLQMVATLIALDGELTPEMEQALAINETELQEKAVSYRHVISAINAEVDMIDKQIELLQQQKKKRTTAVERMKEAISQAMQIYHIEKIEVPGCVLSFRKSKSIQIFDEAELPLEYWNIKEVKTPDKTKIKEALENHIEVPGAVQIENKNLQIK